VYPASAHIHFGNAQGALIENCWAWRMPYQIKLDQGSLITIRSCNVSGVWDGAQASTQEGIAGIWVGATAYIQIVKILDCYLGGVKSVNRNITYTSSDTGAHVANTVQNCGSQYGLLISQCEDFVFDNSYVGINWSSNILVNLVSGGVALGWRITNNFIDSCGYNEAMLTFNTQANTEYVSGITISNNNFNGELQAFQAIQAYNATGTAPVITNFTITGNYFSATVGSAIMLYHAVGGTVAGNSITSYNCRNFSSGTADLTFTCGVYCSSSAHFLLIS
jgi:hypothetical protein